MAGCRCHSCHPHGHLQYGMNFKWMPERQFGYPTAVAVTLTGCAIVFDVSDARWLGAGRFPARTLRS